MQEEKKFLAAALEKSLFGVSAVLFPVLGLMILLFPVILELVPRYQKWEPALPSFYFLCAGAGVSALSNLLTNTLDATGQVRTTLKLMVMWIVLTWVLTLALVPRFGFTGVAAASFSVSLSIMVTIYLVKKSLPFRFLPMILPALAATGVMVGGGGWLLSFLPASLGKVGAGAVSGLIIYGGIMLFLAHKEITGNVRILTRIFFS
jgi:O-antigen/teichoic acid export membrane protein